MDASQKFSIDINTYGSLDELVEDITLAIENTSPKDIYSVFLSRNAVISYLFSQIQSLSKLFDKDKKEIGQTLNVLKIQAENKANRSPDKKNIEQIASFDPTLDITRKSVGKLHPIAKEKIKTEELFMHMGFDVIEDNLVETDFNVFESLNLPPNHPARDMWDTFWTSQEQVLRVHTTAFQNHLLKEAAAKNTFPIRAIQPGVCFRNEATDARHEHTFYQVDGLYVEKKSDRQVTIIDLIATLTTFFSSYFEKEMNIRIQPAYFPFVEPGFEFAISCPFCDQKGCSVCSQSGWLEVGGTGMVHPNVFAFAGLDPHEYSGFAFGYGLDRMSQIKLDINDVRLFRSNDLRFISHT